MYVMKYCMKNCLVIVEKMALLSINILLHWSTEVKKFDHVENYSNRRCLSKELRFVHAMKRHWK